MWFLNMNAIKKLTHMTSVKEMYQLFKPRFKEMNNLVI
jgi:hypothetical protein